MRFPRLGCDGLHAVGLSVEAARFAEAALRPVFHLPTKVAPHSLPTQLIAERRAAFKLVARSTQLGAGGGTAVVIHASPEDESTDPTGNSGARIACRVITKSGS